MALQTMVLDPDAQTYTDDEIVGKVNSATANITREGSVEAAARPIEDLEVTNAKLSVGSSKANLDDMDDTERGYIQTSPVTDQFKVVSIERAADGKMNVQYDDVAEV